MKNIVFGLLVFAFLVSSVSAVCSVAGYLHNSTGYAVYGNSSIYCQGLSQTNFFSSNQFYATSFGGVLDNCNVCSPLLLVTSTNATLGIIGTNQTTSGFGTSYIEMNVTLAFPAPSGLTWTTPPTPVAGSRTNSHAITLNFTFVESSPDTCKIQLDGTNHTGTITSNRCSYYAGDLSEASHTAIGYLNNTYGVWGSTVSRTWTNDYTSPVVTWSPSMPANRSTLAQDYIYWNCSFVESYPSTCYIEVNGTNRTGTVSGSNCYYNSTGLTNDNSYRALCYLSDTAGNWGMTANELDYYLHIASTPPSGGGGGGGSSGQVKCFFKDCKSELNVTLGIFEVNDTILEIYNNVSTGDITVQIDGENPVQFNTENPFVFKGSKQLIAAIYPELFPDDYSTKINFVINNGSKTFTYTVNRHVVWRLTPIDFRAIVYYLKMYFPLMLFGASAVWFAINANQYFFKRNKKVFVKLAASALLFIIAVFMLGVVV